MRDIAAGAKRVRADDNTDIASKGKTSVAAKRRVRSCEATNTARSDPENEGARVVGGRRCLGKSLGRRGLPGEFRWGSPRAPGPVRRGAQARLPVRDHLSSPSGQGAP